MIRVESLSSAAAAGAADGGGVRLEISPGQRVARLALADGEVIVVGRVHELIDSFSVGMEATRPLAALAGVRAAEAERMLQLANGAFVAIVVREGSATVLRDRLPRRTLYYGTDGRRSIVCTSPQRISDDLGFARELDPERLAEICLYRNLVDEQTLFRGVRRLHNDEWIRLRDGRVELERLDVGAVSMPDVPVGRAGDPDCLELGREMFRRAVRIRLDAARAEPITLLLSAGRDSRVLMAVAHELGVSDMLGVTIGSREGSDESAVAVPYARKLGYRCEAFMEQDLDLRGLVEPWVEHCGYPPKNYNHLLLEAAFRQLAPRGGQLWTGDVSQGHSRTLLAMVLEARRRVPWPPPGFWRLLLPICPGRLHRPVWLLSLDPVGAVTYSLSPERSLEEAREAAARVGRRVSAFDPVPHRSAGLSRTIARHGRLDQDAFNWLHRDTVFATSVRSRRLLAKVLGAEHDYPLHDVVLFAFKRGLHPRLPPAHRYNMWWQEHVYEHWLPRGEWAHKQRLVGRLARWFTDPKKLGGYVDVVASRECRERGVFEPAVVRSLVDRRDRLTAGEARALWTVLGLELLFRGGTLRAQSRDRSV